MTSKNFNKLAVCKEPKTPHDEIMFCIESTNDIVSKILELLEKHAKHIERIYELDEE